MKPYTAIDSDGSVFWAVGKAAQDISKKIRIGRKADPKKKRPYQTFDTKCKKAKYYHELKELQDWLDKYKEVEYDCYKLHVKAEIDRHISRFYAKQGVNHAKLGR